jgi:hypothetical protein
MENVLARPAAIYWTGLDGTKNDTAEGGQQWVSEWLPAPITHSSTQTPPVVEVEAPLLNKHMPRKEHKSLSWIPTGSNYCAGENQEQFNKQTDRSWTIGAMIRGEVVASQ